MIRDYVERQLNIIPHYALPPLQQKEESMAYRRRRRSRMFGRKPRSYKAFYGRRRRKIYSSKLLSRRGGFIRP